MGNRTKPIPKGTRFGRLVVVCQAPSIEGTQGKKAVWNCECDCGSFLKVKGQDLRRGSTRSCGCLYRDTRAPLGLRLPMTLGAHARPGGKAP